MLPSGNDAAYCLAENIGALLYFEQKGQIKEVEGLNNFDFNSQAKVVKNCALLCFVKEMNFVASTLQLKNTNFTNPHGLHDKNNISTAEDMAVLSNTLVNEDPIVTQLSGCKTYSFTIYNNNKSFRNIEWINTNELIDQDGFLGLKTGRTSTAGGCLSTYYKLFDKKQYKIVELVIVVLNCQNIDNRFSDTVTLIDWAIEQMR